MTEKVYGGNKVRTYELGGTIKHEFSSEPYSFSLYPLEAGKKLKLGADLGTYCVYVLKAQSKLGVRFSDTGETLQKGDVAQVNRQEIELEVLDGQAQLLVAGTRETPDLRSVCTLVPAAKIYKVEKPWGHELWITGKNHPTYALKQLFIKTGTKTSLQYHRIKRETIVLFDGEAKIHYKANHQVSNDEVKAEDISTVSLKPVSSLDVFPDVLHRMEAVTPLTFYEASTPHLDDVVRVADDNQRMSGTIASEHRQKT